MSKKLLVSAVKCASHALLWCSLHYRRHCCGQSRLLKGGRSAGPVTGQSPWLLGIHVLPPKIATFCLAVGSVGAMGNCHSLLTVVLGQATPFLCTLSTLPFLDNSAGCLGFQKQNSPNRVLMQRKLNFSFLRVSLQGDRPGWGQGIRSPVSHCFALRGEKHETRLHFLSGYLATLVKSTMDSY